MATKQITQLYKELMKGLCVEDPNFDKAVALVSGTASLEAIATAGDDVISIKYIHLASELLDYAGLYPEAALVIQDRGTKYRNELQNITPESLKDVDAVDVELIKQKTLAVVGLGFVFYRSEQLDRALSVFMEALRIAEFLKDKKVSISGTMARIHYAVGLVHRESFHYSAAKDNFTAGTKFAWDYLASHRENEVFPKVLSDLAIAKGLGLGLAWVLYSEGRLKLSIPLLLAAKALLENYKNEVLIKAYIDVIYACVLRAESGDNPRILKESIDTLEKSFEVFNKKQHNYYRIRAAHYLSIAYVETVRNAQTPEEKKKAADGAEKYLAVIYASKSRRMISMGKVIESRLRRLGGNAENAEALGDEAHQMASQRPAITFVLTDALIARGEARLTRYEEDRVNRATGESEDMNSKNLEDRLTLAEEDFTEAAKIGEHNPKVFSVCLLYLTMVHTMRKDVRSSMRKFSEWEQEPRPIKGNAFIRGLEADVRKRLKDIAGDFIVPFDADALDVERIMNELHTFLIRWAKKGTTSESEAIAKLGVSRQTFYNWRKPIA